MTVYKSLLNGACYKIDRQRVLKRNAQAWQISQHLKPCDLAHFPFIGVNVSKKVFDNESH